jgi:hypothetical protein
VLSFDTMHAITDHLYLADNAHALDSLAAAATVLLLLLLLHEHTDPTSARPRRRVPPAGRWRRPCRG